MDRTDGASWIVLGREGDDAVAAVLGPDGAERDRIALRAAKISDWVAAAEAAGPVRWVWGDTPRWYADLLAAGVRVARCHDLRLCHAILRDSELVASDAPVRTAALWDVTPFVEESDVAPALFDLGDSEDAPTGPPNGIDECLREFVRQRAAIEASADAGRLRLLTAAESAGALIAVELRTAGLPWDAPTHEALLTEVLGERVAGGAPHKLEDAARRVRDALGDPTASLDSQPKLLAIAAPGGDPGRVHEPVGARRVPASGHRSAPGVQEAFASAERQRLVVAGRMGARRPVPAGLRPRGRGDRAVGVLRRRGAADPAATAARRARRSRLDVWWSPTSLSSSPGCSPRWPRDTALADAARGKDLYAGIVETGAVAHARRGEDRDARRDVRGHDGRQRATRAPLATQVTRARWRSSTSAARTGEDGGVVSTWLGRSSPPPSATWREAQSRASDAAASGVDETRARRWARDRGRFTRNFVVQGTAAEWALAWLADLRGRLAAMPPVAAEDAAPRSGVVFAARPHLAFFLHDEVIDAHAGRSTRRRRPTRCARPRHPPPDFCSEISRSTCRSNCGSPRAREG